MCFKPKMPEPTQEELQAEAELSSLRKAQQAELNVEKSEAKRKRTEEAITKLKGRYGFSSLLSRSGARGFISNYGRITSIPNYGSIPTKPTQKLFKRRPLTSGERQAVVPAARNSQRSIINPKGN